MRPRVAAIDPDTPFGERFLRGLGYPVRGAARVIMIGLILLHLLVLVPFIPSILVNFFAWAATWRYAVDCLLHTAHGFAEPPEVGRGESDAAAWWLTVVHVVAFCLCIAIPTMEPHLFWPTLLAVALVLPAIDMALAFEGSLLASLNPGHWGRIIQRFGMAYLLPVAINLLVGVLVAIASIATRHLPRPMSLPIFAFAYSYLIILSFHLMGALIHQRHARFGLEPEAHALADALGDHADRDLRAQAQLLAADDPMAATQLLVPRLQDRDAPAELHQLYRDLLRRQNLREALLVHGQIRIAAFMANDESRRALGMMQDCLGIDPDFLPDDPVNAGMLAETAARAGMQRMALKLCRGWLQSWPRDPNAPTVALLAARLLEGEGKATEAAVLLGRTARAWPDHPRHTELQAQINRLQGSHA